MYILTYTFIFQHINDIKFIILVIFTNFKFTIIL